MISYDAETDRYIKVSMIKHWTKIVHTNDTD